MNNATALPVPAARRAPGLGRLGWAVAALATVALLWLVFAMIVAAQPLGAVGLLVVGGLAIYIYATSTSVAWKYLFPGVAGMLVFVAFPLLYTVQIGFTNYSSAHLLSFERARAYLLEQSLVDEAQLRAFSLLREGQGGGRLRLVLAPREGVDEPALVSPPIEGNGPPPSQALAMAPGVVPAGQVLSMRELIALRPLLQGLKLAVPGSGAPLAYAGLREFGLITPVWKSGTEGALTRLADGATYRPNFDAGAFENAAGERIQPGFTVAIGFANYSRMLFDADFRGPFVAIFIWTVAFAGLSVLFSTALGMTLAVMLNWERLAHRTLYRTLLFLPYAVPGFISILVFKGLFNQNFGEINAILDALFGVRPAWFADPLLAKAMILIVNTWLGYPYVMVLCTGLIKAIPSDLYEASALAGAGPLTNFFKITAPLIVRPLTPLLISAFAFNFNNFVLIALLTDGRPDFLNTKLPAGTTDILVSYTYRIAFTDSGQNFGLAAAISTIIFVMVALMALLQLKFTQKAAVRA
jgi:maltose/maltodextrin transport system permease protein